MPKKITQYELLISCPGDIKDELQAIDRCVTRFNDLYLALVPDASEEEISDLKEWVAAGSSPYANPWYIADERGTELPFIEARRVIFILAEEMD